MAFKAGPESQKQAATSLRAMQAHNRAELTKRLLAAYRAEPDREYAEAFYGEMLRERGVEPTRV
jgi:hypothetical protein